MVMMMMMMKKNNWFDLSSLKLTNNTFRFWFERIHCNQYFHWWPSNCYYISYNSNNRRHLQCRFFNRFRESIIEFHSSKIFNVRINIKTHFSFSFSQFDLFFMVLYYNVLNLVKEDHDVKRLTWRDQFDHNLL
jgi:hypothetical protein